MLLVLFYLQMPGWRGGALFLELSWLHAPNPKCWSVHPHSCNWIRCHQHAQGAIALEGLRMLFEAPYNIFVQQCCFPNWSLLLISWRAVKLETPDALFRTCRLHGVRWNPVVRYSLPYSRKCPVMRRMERTSPNTWPKKSRRSVSS